MVIYYNVSNKFIKFKLTVKTIKNFKKKTCKYVYQQIHILLI